MGVKSNQDELSPRFARFAAEWVKTGNATIAALACGYSPKSARQIGSKLLKDPLVRAEVDRLRAEVREQGKYNLEKAMKECEDAMAFAKRTDNATALVRAVELRSKLSGLLDLKIDVKATSGFQIVFAGIDEPVRNVSPIEIESGKNQTDDNLLSDSQGEIKDV